MNHKVVSELVDKGHGEISVGRDKAGGVQVFGATQGTGKLAEKYAKIMEASRMVIEHYEACGVDFGEEVVVVSRQDIERLNEALQEVQQKIGSKSGHEL